MRSTDWPSRGRVGEVDIDTLTRRWGKRYEGWAGDIGGRTVAGVSSSRPTSSQRLAHVYVNRLRYGVKDSDSVRHLQRRLIGLGYKIPAGATGNYYGQTQAAVAALQKDWNQAPQYATGRRLGPRQAARLWRGDSHMRIHP